MRSSLETKITGRLVFSTYRTKREASKIARKAVSDRLAACANIFPIYSIYAWEGKIEEGLEVMVLYKTTSTKLRLLRRYIRDSHGYRVPEIVDLEMTSVNRSYLEWLVSATSSDSGVPQQRHNTA